MKSPTCTSRPIFFCLAMLLSAGLAAHAEPPTLPPPIAPMKGTPELTPPVDPNTFTFIAFGDSQGQPSYTTLSNICHDVKNVLKPRPDFALCLGDIIKGHRTPPFPIAAVESNLTKAIEHLKPAGIPVFNAPGNHEMDDIVYDPNWQERPSVKMFTAYTNMVGRTYGSFDYGNSHFVILNTEDLPEKGKKIPPSADEFSYIGEKQFAWLKADLDASTNKTHVFIAMHYPLHGKYRKDNLLPESRDKLLALIAQYSNIAYVLCSHEHIFYNPQDPFNVETVAPFTAGALPRYLVSGGAGANMYAASGPNAIYVPPMHWSFHHYLLFKVEGRKITVEIKRVAPYYVKPQS